MNTVVTVHVVGSTETADVGAAIDRAFGWFHEIEERCSRFTPDSELVRLSHHAGRPVAVSSILYEAVQFALLIAEETGGAFDPTVGREMAARGFDREYRTGAQIRSQGEAGGDISYQDIELDADGRTITLLRPLTLDLGAVAKGLAVDAAVRELEPFRDFAIDAGGDLYLAGTNDHGEPWLVGIRHPRHDNELIASLRVQDRAVCTSGDYERRAPGAVVGHHILDPRTGSCASAVASATVVAPGAMLADALATAAFVLGPERGIALLTRLGVEGLIVTPDLQQFETGGLRRAA